MKRIFIALALFLGVLGGVNAQEFDFECDTPESGFIESAVVEHKGFAYDSVNQTLTFRGLNYIRHDGDYSAPEGAFNQDRYAGVGLRVKEDGRWKLTYQNNGLCPCTTENYTEDGNYFYNPGQFRVWDWVTFEEAVEQMFLYNNRTFIPNNIFFADRNGPSVNHRRLNQWTGNSGWTREPINGMYYPGNIRFTKNGDNWTLIFEINNVGKVMRKSITEEEIVSDLPTLVKYFEEIYYSTQQR